MTQIRQNQQHHNIKLKINTHKKSNEAMKKGGVTDLKADRNAVEEGLGRWRRRRWIG